jgi:cell division protein FtsB
MATYEELLEIIKAQQKTIEKLTAELEAAREEIAELKEKLNKDSHKELCKNKLVDID